MEHFVYLFSSTSSNYLNHQNHLLHFHTELARPLELNGEWQVCLKELHYPKLVADKSVYFFVYSNIVGYTLVGSKQFPVLRPVLLRNNQDTHWVCNFDRFENDIYVPVQEKTIRNIELLFEPDLDRTDTNQLFYPGDIVAVLHFTRVT